ncbi:futalosine hydrolase [uncultured Mucilaginibacter sp.]|uniref:futalosine hydrolase n=1 Tax=uncultured Mucilaginibacter sp. TaxID=797541 RepID=UPI0025F7A805|nr:futalosine hydrolase [uncultured Mucilaginibacter sp.]
MRILVVVATELEVGSLISDFGFSISELAENSDLRLFKIKSEIEHPTSEILITGVGMVATAFALGRHLAANKCDLVLNLGIAGSFDRNIAIGELVEISQDTLAELGAEDDGEFLPIEKMGFGEATFYPTTQLTDLYNLFNNFNLKNVSAITVNTVHGNEASIKKVSERLNPQLESMEGAAFFYACKQMDVPCIQIRAVSNYVEKRNRDNWNMGLAIKNLNTFAIEFLKMYA